LFINIRNMDSKLFANIVLLIIFATAAVGNLMAWGFNKTRWVPVTKPVLMPVLAIYYVLNCPDVKLVLVFALLFAFLGDVFLIWPQKKLFFICGLAFFMIMQVLYVIFIVKNQVNDVGYTVPALAASLVFLVFGAMIYLKLYRFLNEMKIPVLVYVMVLLTVSFLCFVNMIANFNRFSVVEFLGAVFFVVSDTILAFDSFRRPVRYANLWIMATYINAQLFLFAGFMYT